MNKGITLALASMTTVALLTLSAVSVSAASPNQVSSQAPPVQWQTSAPTITHALGLAPGQSRTITDEFVTPSGRHITETLVATRLTSPAAEALLRAGRMSQSEYAQVAAGDPTYNFDFEYNDEALGIGYGISDTTIWSTNCSSSITVSSQIPSDWAIFPYGVGSVDTYASYPTGGEALWEGDTNATFFSAAGVTLASGTLSITMQSYANVQGVVMYPHDPFDSGAQAVDYTALGCN